MTSKKGHTLRIESEIDRNREDGNWKKVIQLAEHLKVQYPSNGKCLSFLPPFLPLPSAMIPPSDRGSLLYSYFDKCLTVSCELCVRKGEEERKKMSRHIKIDREKKMSRHVKIKDICGLRERNVTLVPFNYISSYTYPRCFALSFISFFNLAIALLHDRHAKRK